MSSDLSEEVKAFVAGETGALRISKEELRKSAPVEEEKIDTPAVDEKIKVPLAGPPAGHELSFGSEFSPVPVTPAMVTAYENSIISGKRFVWTFDILRGNASVTFQARTQRENEAVVYEIKRRLSLLFSGAGNDLGVVEDQAAEAVHITQVLGQRWYLFFSLVAIGNEQVLPRKYSAEELRAHRKDGEVRPPVWVADAEEVFADMPQNRYSLLLLLRNQFEVMYSTIGAKALDKNFCQAGDCA